MLSRSHICIFQTLYDHYHCLHPPLVPLRLSEAHLFVTETLKLHFTSTSVGTDLICPSSNSSILITGQHFYRRTLLACGSLKVP